MNQEDQRPRAVLGPADYALACVCAWVGGRRPPEAPSDEFYRTRAACFVTLKKNGELRGCIGTLEPAEGTLGQEIARNARCSAMRDPRFSPVTEDEVAAVACSVDVLSDSESCTEDDLDPKAYGVIVQSGCRRGVLLPDLFGVDTVPAQVSIALQKAGIAPGEPYDCRRFRVTRYHQGDAPSAFTDDVTCPADD